MRHPGPALLLATAVAQLPLRLACLQGGRQHLARTVFKFLLDNWYKFVLLGIIITVIVLVSVKVRAPANCEPACALIVALRGGVQGSRTQRDCLYCRACRRASLYLAPSSSGSRPETTGRGGASS